MAMNSSGPISLAGPNIGQSIALTIGRTATSTTSLNDPDVRTLAQVPSGPIEMPTNFYNKAWSANAADFFMMGGGGTYGNGGNPGGGGQMVTVLSAPVTKGVQYNITVGAAGSSSSVFNGAYTAIAGGNGGGWTNGSSTCTNGGTGATGGTGGYSLCPGTTCSGGGSSIGAGSGGTSAIYLQNNGSGCTAWSANGGSGGLGGSGTNGTISGNPYGGGALQGGNGGAPAYSTFNPSGTSIAYGGGLGGQACWISDGPNTNCHNGSTIGSPGANTGYGNYSGVVIIRISNQFQTPTTTGSPTFTNSGGYFWYTFTGSGSITF